MEGNHSKNTLNHFSFPFQAAPSGRSNTKPCLSESRFHLGNNYSLVIKKKYKNHHAIDSQPRKPRRLSGKLPWQPVRCRDNTLAYHVFKISSKENTVKLFVTIELKTSDKYNAVLLPPIIICSTNVPASIPFSAEIIYCAF